MNHRPLPPLAWLVLAASGVAQVEPPPPPQPAQILRLGGGVAPAPQSQEDLVKLRDEKLAKDWLKKAPWHTDYDEAKALARSRKKPMLAYFTRSYAP